MKIERAVGEIIYGNNLSYVRVATAWRAATECVLDSNAVRAIAVSAGNAIGSRRDVHRIANGINRLLRRISHPVPKPLLSKLVLAIHAPIEHALLAAGINV